MIAIRDATGREKFRKGTGYSWFPFSFLCPKRMGTLYRLPFIAVTSVNGDPFFFFVAVSFSPSVAGVWSVGPGRPDRVELVGAGRCCKSHFACENFLKSEKISQLILRGILRRWNL